MTFYCFFCFEFFFAPPKVYLTFHSGMLWLVCPPQAKKILGSPKILTTLSRVFAYPQAPILRMDNTNPIGNKKHLQSAWYMSHQDRGIVLFFCGALPKKISPLIVPQIIHNIFPDKIWCIFPLLKDKYAQIAFPQPKMFSSSKKIIPSTKTPWSERFLQNYPQVNRWSGK